ncbi:MAG: hypothetical protein H6R40_808 [Gemmatimonadetes bacterium]|nr:hypothetical protein [Gemmatimonadota bacterium]
MNESIRERILRRLEGLSDERGYQILDFMEFLESKYAERSAGGGFLSRVFESGESAMRAAGVPVKVITGTMGLADSAGKVMKGVAAAAQAVVEEAVKAAGPGQTAPPARQEPAAKPAGGGSPA